MDYGNRNLEIGDIVTINGIPGIWRVTNKYKLSFEKFHRVDVALVATVGLMPPPVPKHRTRQIVMNVFRVRQEELDMVMDQIREIYRHLSENIRED